MHRLVWLALLLVPACVTDEPFDTTVAWTTSNPPSTPNGHEVIAVVGYEGTSLETRDGYDGQMQIWGTTTAPQLTICVQLVYDERYIPGDLEFCNLTGDCPTMHRVALTDERCQSVNPSTPRVSFDF